MGLRQVFSCRLIFKILILYLITPSCILYRRGMHRVWYIWDILSLSSPPLCRWTPPQLSAPDPPPLTARTRPGCLVQDTHLAAGKMSAHPVAEKEGKDVMMIRYHRHEYFPLMEGRCFSSPSPPSSGPAVVSHRLQLGPWSHSTVCCSEWSHPPLRPPPPTQRGCEPPCQQWWRATLPLCGDFARQHL